jgi:DNA-3-methyladenine glycosylase
MFLDHGHAYVYRIYGMWHCLNVTAGPRHSGAAVLIRALQPVAGIEAMRERRPGAADRELMRGPGRLCVALEIDLSLDGIDLCGDERLWLAEGVAFADSPGRSGRIGISKAADKMLRFYVPKNTFISGSGTKR